MNDKPKEKVYAERLDSSKKSGKDHERSNPRPQKENPKTKENKNSNLRKRGFTLIFSFKCQTKINGW